MNPKIKLLALCGVLCAASASHAALVYSAQELGNLGGVGISGLQVNAFDLNDKGQVVGAAYVNTPFGVKFHAFMTGENGVGLTDIGQQINAGNSAAYAVNNSGQVAGAFNMGAAGSGEAYISGSNGIGYTPLFASGSFSRGSSINASGQVTGFDSLQGAQKAFVTGSNGSAPVILGNGWGVSINRAGQVVADSSNALFADAGSTTLVSLGFETLPGGASSKGVDAINDNALAVGWVGALHYAFVYDIKTHTKVADIGNIGSPIISDDSMDINNAGVVVGRDSSSGNAHAFIWGLNGAGKQNLNDLVLLPTGVFLTSARGINDLGQIVANASNGRAYLLSPVPEPSTGVLTVAGLVGIGVVRRMRRVA